MTLSDHDTSAIRSNAGELFGDLRPDDVIPRAPARYADRFDDLLSALHRGDGEAARQECSRLMDWIADIEWQEFFGPEDFAKYDIEVEDFEGDRSRDFSDRSAVDDEDLIAATLAVAARLIDDGALNAAACEIANLMHPQDPDMVRDKYAQSPKIK